MTSPLPIPQGPHQPKAGVEIAGDCIVLAQGLTWAGPREEEVEGVVGLCPPHDLMIIHDIQANGGS